MQGHKIVGILIEALEAKDFAKVALKTNKLFKIPPKELAHFIVHHINKNNQFMQSNRYSNAQPIFEIYTEFFLQNKKEISEENFLSLHWLFDFFYLDKTNLNIDSKLIITSKFSVAEEKIDTMLKTIYNLNQENGFTNVFQGFPTKEAWRLCIPFDHQKQKKYEIWNEKQHPLYGSRTAPGYIENTLNCLISAIAKPEEKLSVELIKKLHAICIDSKYTSRIHTGNPLHFSIDFNQAMSYDGYRELQEKYIFSADYYFHTDGTLSPQYSLSYTEQYDLNKKYLEKICASKCESEFTNYCQPFNNIKNERSNVEEKINNIIEEYNKNTEDPKVNSNPRLLLKEIVKMAKELRCIRPFEFANSTLFYLVLMTKEIIRHNLPPMIIGNLEMITGLSTDQAIQHVIIPGMLNFQLVKNGKLPNGMVTTDQLIEKHGKDQYPIPGILESQATDLFDFLQEQKTQIDNPKISSEKGKGLSSSS